MSNAERYRLTAGLVAAIVAMSMVGQIPQANADPDACRIAADGHAYTSTGQRCRGSDLDLWHTGSPQLLCWYTPSDPMCGDHSGAGPGAR